MPDKIRVSVPATTANLGPGFDCLGLALQIRNIAEFELGGPRLVEVSVGGSVQATHLPLDESNLVYRAATRIFEIVGKPVPPMRLRLTIEAPLARGLGSSASAIVAGIAGANALLGNPVAVENLLQEMTKMEGHPDNVAPCFLGGLVASLWADGKVHYLRRIPAENVRFVLAIPNYELATSRAREAIPRAVPIKDAIFNMSRIPFVMEALTTGPLDLAEVAMEDRLHQPYRKDLVAGYDPIVSAAEGAGAAAVCLSGAGPTMLAVCDASKAPAVSQALSRVVADLSIRGTVRTVAADTDGATVEAF